MHKSSCANAVVVGGICTEIVQRFLDVNASSTHLQRGINAVKAQCTHCECHESIVRAQRITNKNSVGT